MNWKIIFQLSIFGLIMAFATISLIPEDIEPVFWLIIAVFCAFVIAKVCKRKYFLHGFWLSMINCVWITAAHIIWIKTYVGNHMDTAVKIESAMPSSLSAHLKWSMIIVAPIFGAMFGVIQGLFAFLASRIVTKESYT